MVYNAHPHKCLTCYLEIQTGQEEGFIREHSQMRYYHLHWQDCQDALRGFQPRKVEMLPKARRQGTTEETVDA